MFKEILKFDANTYDFVATLAKSGLVLFFAAFVVMAIYASTRRRKDVDRWSRLALDDEPAPAQADRDLTL